MEESGAAAPDSSTRTGAVLPLPRELLPPFPAVRRPLGFVAAVIAVLLTVVAPVDAIGSDPPSMHAGTTRRLGDSVDPVVAAIDVSRGTWADGEATTVVLARSDVFADSLAGAVLAGGRGPLLFVPAGTTTVPPSVADEIDRVLGPAIGCPDPREVIVLGGHDAVPTDARSTGHCTRRIAGADRIETAIAVAADVVAHGGDTSTVLLARSHAWADAATGSAFAASGGHPILVTPGDALDQRVVDALRGLAPRRIVLLGGQGALGDAVEIAARDLAPHVVRVAGVTRDATAAQLATTLVPSSGQRGVLLVNGFADGAWTYALAGAVTAAREGATVVYADHDALPVASASYVDRGADSFSIVVGPDSLVAPAVVADVEGRRGALEPPGAGERRYRDEVFTLTRDASTVYRTAVDHRGITVDLLMNVYEPQHDPVSQRPAVIFVHGGGFYRGGVGNREQPTYLPLVRRGFVVATIEYRIIPPPGCVDGPADTCEAGMRDALEDAQAAVAFLREHASAYRIDRSRIAIVGSSAGGMTALHVGYGSEEHPDTAVRAAVSYSGANVIGQVTPGDAPALLLHGVKDDIVDYSLAEQTVADAKGGGLLALLRTFPVGHDLSPYRADLVEQTVRFLWWQMDLQGAAR